MPPYHVIIIHSTKVRVVFTVMQRHLQLVTLDHRHPTKSNLPIRGGRNERDADCE